MRFLQPMSVFLAAALLSGCGSSGGSGGGGGGGGGMTPTGTPVTVTFSTKGSMPTAVAEQIGSGAWTTASVQSGALNLTVPTGTTKYAVAFVCPPVLLQGTLDQENVIEATTSDPTSYTVDCYATTAPITGTATGSVNASAIAGANQVLVRGTQGYGTNVASLVGTFSTPMISGTNDVAAVAEDGSNNVLGVKIVRNQSIPGAVNGGNPILLAASDATTTQSFTVTNVSAGYGATPAIDATYNTSNGTNFGVTGSSTSSYRAGPASEAAAGDSYNFEANDANLATHELLGLYENTTGGGAVSLALPTPWTFTPPAAAQFPTFTFNYAGFSGDAAVVDQSQISWSLNASTQAEIDVYATAAYQGAATSVTIPNLTALTGFLASAPTGTTVYWLAQVNGGSYAVFQAAQPSGGNLSLVQASGTYFEP